MQALAANQELQARRLVAFGPPLIIEGLRSLGCDVVASTGFIAQLPVLVARNAPSAVVAYVDARNVESLERGLRAIRDALPACRLVVLMPVHAMSEWQESLSAIGCELYRDDLEAAAMQLALGVGFAAPMLLTRREVDVLTFAAEGLSNQVIGRRLGLQLNTVKNYMRSIHRKLGATSRTEAVMIAARAGYPVIRLR